MLPKFRRHQQSQRPAPSGRPMKSPIETPTISSSRKKPIWRMPKSRTCNIIGSLFQMTIANPQPTNGGAIAKIRRQPIACHRSALKNTPVSSESADVTPMKTMRSWRSRSIRSGSSADVRRTS